MSTSTPLFDTVVSAEFDGARLDQALAGLVPGLSRAAARRLADGGSVFVDGRRARRLSAPVAAGAHLVGYPPAPAPRQPTGVIPVLARSGDVWLIDKPAGMAVEPTRRGARHTVVDSMRRAGQRVFVTHRLDAPTSGVLAIATTAAAQRDLNRQFAEHRARRLYLAVVSPPPSWEHTTFDAPLEGKPATTHARVVGRSATAALLLVDLGTGRSRQIRRHLAGAGHPVVGDREAGARLRGPLLLHALHLAVTVRGAPLAAMSVPPTTFVETLPRLGLSATREEVVRLVANEGLAPKGG